MSGSPRSGRPFRRYLRKIYALPSEHGAWIWWIGPFALGIAAGGEANRATLLLLLAGLTAFLVRQPVTLLVKVLSKRRPSRDLQPTLFWTGIYVALTSLILIDLIRLGYGRLLWLGAAGGPVFLAYLWLVSRGEERGQRGIELVGSGTLALTAPAAYWVSGEEDALQAWILWILCWLQAAASIVYVYLRLGQRKLEQMPARGDRWRMGARTLAYHSFNVLLSGVLALYKTIPVGVVFAFGLMLGDALEGVARSPVGRKPSAIGVRQLAFSALFFLVTCLAYIA